MWSSDFRLTLQYRIGALVFRRSDMLTLPHVSEENPPGNAEFDVPSIGIWLSKNGSDRSKMQGNGP
jgi:hypothetical protein